MDTWYMPDGRTITRKLYSEMSEDELDQSIRAYSDIQPEWFKSVEDKCKFLRGEDVTVKAPIHIEDWQHVYGSGF